MIFIRNCITLFDEYTFNMSTLFKKICFDNFWIDKKVPYCTTYVVNFWEFFRFSVDVHCFRIMKCLEFMWDSGSVYLAICMWWISHCNAA